MTDEAAIRAVLDEIKALGARLEDRISGLEGGISALGTRMSGLDIHMSGFERRMSKIEDVVASLELEIKTWPDLHYLASAAKLQLGYTRETKADVVEIRTRLDEIYRMMATGPEVRNLRADVARFRDQSLDTELRLGGIEGRLGIKETAEPR